MLRVSKKEAIYFEYFSKMVDMSHDAAVALEEMMTNFVDVEEKIRLISEIEHNCDGLVHSILKKLNSAFITPIDREDIFTIAKELDNIIDNIEETAHRFVIYNLSSVKPEAIDIAKLITSSTSHLQVLFGELVHMKFSSIILKEIIEVNRLENSGDVIYRTELTKLFSGDTEAIDIIRWEGIYGYLEKALDACEDIANIIEGVVMKHA